MTATILTQHQIIIERMLDGQWHCGNEFREWYIFSGHKRRIEIEGRKNRQEPITGKYKFLERPCEHNSKNVKDYLMVENETYKPTPPEVKKRVVFLEGKPTLVFN